METGEEIDDSVGDDARLRADLDRGLLSGVPFALSGDEMPGDFDAGNVCEGVELFCLCCVVPGWNETGFSGKLDDLGQFKGFEDVALIHSRVELVRMVELLVAVTCVDVVAVMQH